VSVMTKRVVEIRGAVGEAERARVGLEASERRLPVERLVRLLVVAVIEVMAEAQLERAAVVVDVGGAGGRPRRIWLPAVWLNFSILPCPSG